MDEFDDEAVVMEQLNVFCKMCKPGTVIKRTKNKFNEKDALVFFNKKLSAIIECKRRYRVYDSWILEVPKVMHWIEQYPDLDFIYLNRCPLGDFYLNVKKLKLKKHIKNGTLASLDGSNGVKYMLGSRLDRGWNSDQDREWLLISNDLFKKVKS